MGSSKLTVTRLKNNLRDNVFLGTSSLYKHLGPITCCKEYIMLLKSEYTTQWYSTKLQHSLD
ncbi:hypothetical protein P691DRAFT_801533, partial [Macrolepiota fuliginosa MF-IS2]